VNVVVTDQYIANNTADGSVKIVFPHLLDIEVVDVTSNMLDPKTQLINDATKTYYEQLGIS
jgi:hypothetical protein